MFKKFHNITESQGAQVHWHRAPVDRAPFRGNDIPMLRDEEFEERVERVEDCYFATFDTSKPEQTFHNRTLSWIMDAHRAGWVVILFRQHTWHVVDGRPVMFQYIEWSEPYQEISG